MLLLAIPVLLFGEQIVKRVKLIGDSNIPAPIIGGLIVAVAVMLVQELAPGRLGLDGSTSAVAWLWPILPQWDFATPKPDGVHTPLLILFFTCIGLNASWGLARQGGVPLLIYLVIATAFGALQYVSGILTAKALGQSSLLGIMCSGVSLMGGFGTAASWSDEFKKAGLANAREIGIAAAAAGVIAGGLIAGPLAGRLMKRHVHRVAPVNGTTNGTDIPTEPEVLRDDAERKTEPAEPIIDEGGFLADIASMFRHGGSVLIHLLVLAVCLKLGAFVSYYIGGVQVGAQSITFPVYMGSMLVAAVIRNVHDVAGWKFLHTPRVDLIASFALAWMLSVIMIGLRLTQLVESAAPMFVIIGVQVALMSAFCYWIVFRIMGRDYEAAAMSAGMVGFGLGATSNAVATMRQLARRFGPAPRAFLIVTVVGAFLIDFTNAFLIMLFLNVSK
ncbi:MAG: sodium/glutamate symporter [Tepidisphaeraceae bacterium]